MSRARVARRIVTAAALGGGGLSLLGGAAIGLLLTEARMARSAVGTSEEDPPVADGRYGAFLDGADPLDGEPAEGVPPAGGTQPLRLAFLGDSTAAGQGVRRAGETPGALLASGLAAVAERPVDLVNVALSGATSADLARQVGLLLDGEAPPPDVCVVMIGANDVTQRVSPAISVRQLTDAVRALREAGSQVVVGTCPDLGTIEPVAQPLRWIARRLSRQLAAAQTIAVVELGGRTVSLGQLLGPEFEARPREMFGPDNYHPSAAGYATAALAILPTLCASLGLWPDEGTAEGGTATALRVDKAAATAAVRSGTEVASAPVQSGHRRHRALMLRRRAWDGADGDAPADAEEVAALDGMARQASASDGGGPAGTAARGAPDGGAGGSCTLTREASPEAGTPWAQDTAGAAGASATAVAEGAASGVGAAADALAGAGGVAEAAEPAGGPPDADAPQAGGGAGTGLLTRPRRGSSTRRTPSS